MKKSIMPLLTAIPAVLPVSQQRLFIGRGFLWEQKHTHRLVQTYRPEFRPYMEPTAAYRLARRLEDAPFPLSALARFTRWDVPFNPVRPLPPVGGLPRWHGIEPNEMDVWLPLGERVGMHVFWKDQGWRHRAIAGRDRLVKLHVPRSCGQPE